MSQIYFVSDIHLSSNRPDITAAFIDFLENQAPQASKVYILGDLFEVWIGDDDLSEFNLSVIRAFKALSDKGVALFYLHGNRDFLIGKAFAELTGITLLPEQDIVDLFGQRVLICHGDELCTLDQSYQDYRAQVRTPQWQQKILAKPLWVRRLIGRYARFRSYWKYKTSVPEINDVNQQSVLEIMQKYQVDTLIHGHTHKPANHEFCIADQPAKRIVLGDWYSQSSILKVDETGMELIADKLGS